MASSRGVSSETGGRHRSMDLDGSGLPSVGDILDSPESSTSSSAAAKAGALQPGQSRSLGSRRSRGNKWPFPAGMSSRSPSRHHDGDVVWEKDGAGKARPTQQQQQQHQTGSGLSPLRLGAVASPMRARSRTPVPAPAAAGSQATSASSAAPAASAGQAACSSTAACPPTASQPQTARPPLGRSDSRARSAESRYSRARQDASTLFSDSPPSGASSSENDRLLISLMRDPPRTIQGRGLGGNSSAGGTISFGSEGRAASADGSGVTGGGATSSGIGGGPRRLNEDAASSAWSRNRLGQRAGAAAAAAFAPSSMAWEPSTPMGDAMPMSPPPPYDPAHRRADRAPLYSDGRRHAATSAASVPPLNLERARQNRVGVDESIDGEEYQPSEGPADSLPASQLPHLNLTDGHYSLQFPMQLRPDTTPLGQRDRQRPAQRGIMPPANTAATPRWLAGPVDPQGSMQMTGGGCSDGPVHQPHMQAPHMQAPIQPQQSQQHGMQRVSDGLMPPRDAPSGQGPVPAAGFPGDSLPANTTATPSCPVDPQGSMHMAGGGYSGGPVHQPHMQSPHMQAPIQPQQSQQHWMQRVSDGLMPPRDATSGQGPVPAAGFPGDSLPAGPAGPQGSMQMAGGGYSGGPVHQPHMQAPHMQAPVQPQQSQQHGMQRVSDGLMPRRDAPSGQGPVPAAGFPGDSLPANTTATPSWYAGPVDPQGSMHMAGGGYSGGPVHQPHMQAPHMQAPIQPQQSQQHWMQRVSDGLMPPRDATSGQGPVPAAGFPGGPPGHPSQFPASHPPVHSSFGGGITGLASKMVSAVGQVLGGAGPMPPPLRSTQDGTMPSSMSSGGTAGPSAVPPPPPSQNVPQQHQQHQQQQEHQQEQQVQPQQLGGSEGDADVTKTAGNASAASIAPAEEVVWDSQTGTGGGSEPAGQAAPLADADGDVAMGGALVGAQVGGDGESGGGASIAGDAPRNGRRSLGGVSEAAASATETVQSTVSMAVVGVSGEGETVEGFQATETTTVVASVDAAVGSGEGASGHGLGEDPSHASFGGDDSAGFEDPAHVSFGGVQSSPPRTPEVHPSEPARPEMAEMGQQTTPEKPLLEGTEAEATAKRKQLVRRPRGHLSPPPREGSTQLVELGLDAFGRYPASKRPRRNYIPPLKHWKGEQVVYRREPGSEMPTVHGVRMAAEVKADGSLSQPKIPLKPIREGSFARMPLADDPCRLSNASAAPPTPSTSCGSSPGDFEPGSERGTTSSSEEEEVGVSLDKLEKDVRKPQPQAHDGAAHRKRRNKRSRSLGSIREVPAEEDMEPRTLFEEPDQQEEEKEKEEEEEEEEANSSSSTSKMEKRTPKPKPPAAETGAASKKKEKKPTRSRSLGSVRERKKEGRAPARVQPLPPPPSPPRFDDADYEKEGYFVLPVAEGSAKPLGLKVCLDTGLMLVCNILIPPSSWNQEEPLNEGKTMILSVIKGMANTLVCTVGSEDVTLGAGDNIVIQPGVNYRLRNSSDHHIVLAKMILVSSKSDAEDGGDGGDERGMIVD